MIDIQTALYNILHSRYGRDVRQSIHDGIYQINENANEAVQTAKAMGVGTAVSSSTSSSAGYVAGNLYLNSSTWDLWQCVGTNSWLNKGNIQGAQGQKGADGTSNYIFIRYSANYDGTDFTVSPTANSQFMGVYYGSSSTAPTNKQDYQWTSYVGASGTSAYVHIRYSEYADGTDFVTIPMATCKYIGFYAGSSSAAPANKSYYTWSQYVGADGEGHGDMEARVYAPSGVPGTVDKALAATTATNATNSTNASNLKKSNGEVVSADVVTTKLSQLDITGNLSTALGNKANKSTTLSGYGITDAYTKSNTYTKTEVDNKLDGWFSQTPQATATGDQTVTFTGLDTSKAYELWFETSNGSQVGIKSSSLSGTTLSYVVSIPSDCPVPVNFKLRVVK